MSVTRETARLLLRPPEGPDLDALVEIHEHPDVASPLGVKTGDRSAAWRTLAMLMGHWQLRGYGHWVVLEKDTRRIVGRVGLWYPDGWPGIEVGWAIRRADWGRGFATEAATEAVRYAFEEIGLTHLISIIEPDNHRSIRVAEKIGETLESVDVIDGKRVLIYGVRLTGN